MLNDTEQAFLDAVIQKYHNLSMGLSTFSFMDVAYKVAKETDEEGLNEAMPDFSNIDSESQVLSFSNGEIANRPLPTYFYDVNTVMSAYKDGLLLREDAKAYIEAKL